MWGDLRSVRMLSAVSDISPATSVEGQASYPLGATSSECGVGLDFVIVRTFLRIMVPPTAKAINSSMSQMTKKP